MRIAIFTILLSIQTIGIYPKMVWSEDLRVSLENEVAGITSEMTLLPHTSGNLDQAIQAPVAGYFKPEVTLLDDVQKGQQLGTIRDLFGKILSELHANTDGVIIMLRRLHCVRVGDGLAHITKYHPE